MSDRPGDAFEVWRAFNRLGWTSFGGPSAHIGYFRTEFIDRRGWLDERRFAEILALVQVLPGPASSQFGICVGLQRAGLLGGLSAWLGFTLPSALLMLLFAYGVGGLGAFGEAWLHGLKVVVVAVVAQAIWSMAQRLCPDVTRALIAAAGAVAALALSGPPGQLLAIGLGAVVGRLLLRGGESGGAAGDLRPVSGRTAITCLVAFAALLLLLPLLRGVSNSFLIALADSFYRAGALVFGGGHVVLPLLQAEVTAPGWLPSATVLAGYGAAQALPGPLFAFAAYLGAAMGAPATAPALAALCLVMIYLPSALLLLGVLPFWARIRRWRGMEAALAGVCAAVVGLLAAALVDPIFPSAINTVLDLALAAAVLAVLLWGRLPVWAVVIAGGAVGALLPAVG